MRLLFTADWHIKLGQPKVPSLWQTNRFRMMVDELNQACEEHQCDKIIIGGDIFDRFEPTAVEMELYFDLIARLKYPTEIYSGNHEMVSKTKHVLSNLADETSRCNPLVTIVANTRSDDYDIVDYPELKKDKWKEQQSRLCLTHVRGSIPPHVEPEIDLSRFDIYDLVLAGDLHSYQNSQTTEGGTHILYPGSPLTTSFHRERTSKTNGYIILNTKTLNYSWFDLGHLPQLIRKTVSSTDEMVEDDFDRVIYEIEGDLASLKKVKDSDLLDKKINTKVSRPAALQIPNDAKLSDELAIYLSNIEKLKAKQVSSLVSRFTSLIHKD